MKVMIIIAMVCGCTYEVDVQIQTSGKFVQKMCGPMPQTPGYSVAFENNKAILSRNDFIAMAKALRELSDWSFCVSQLP
jgi:hypothetical protein